MTDTSYRPIIALDRQGIVSYLDPTIRWSVVSSDTLGIVFSAVRDKKELGKIIIRGDMITNWVGK
jgi:hypothetical protein